MQFDTNNSILLNKNTRNIQNINNINNTKNPNIIKVMHEGLFNKLLKTTIINTDVIKVIYEELYNKLF